MDCQKDGLVKPFLWFPQKLTCEIGQFWTFVCKVAGESYEFILNLPEKAAEIASWVGSRSMSILASLFTDSATLDLAKTQGRMGEARSICWVPDSLGRYPED
jgi:hypothetical protein